MKNKCILLSLIIILIFSSNPIFSQEELSGQKITFKADYLSSTPRKIVASGNVTAVSKGVTFKADYMELDKPTQILSARGRVLVYSKYDEFSGQSLIYDLATQQAQMYDIRGFTRSIAVSEGQIMPGKLFFWGKKIQQTPSEIKIFDVRSTTCDLLKPHYYFQSKQVVIYPQDKLIAKNTSFFYNNKKWFTLSSLVYSLRPRSRRQSAQTLIPRIGQNSIDGPYIKESLNYLYGKKDYGTIHLDYYNKTGLAYGLDHYFHLGNKGQGSVNYYRLNSKVPETSRHEYSGRLNYKLPENINLVCAYNSSHYQFPGQGIYPVKNSQISLNQSLGRSNLSIASSMYRTGFNQNLAYNLYHSYRLTPNLKSRLYYEHSQNTSYATQNYYSHPMWSLINTGKLFDVELDLERNTGTSFYGVSRLPEISIRSHNLSCGPVDTQLTLNYGAIREKSSPRRYKRGYFQFLVPSKIWRLNKKSFIFTTAGFRHTLYDTGSRQNVWTSRLNWQNRLSNNFIAHLDGFYQSPKGEVELDLDKVDYFKQVGGGVYFYNRNYSLDLSTVYDIKDKTYQDLASRVYFSPKNRWNMNFGTNFNLNKGNFRQLDAQLDLQLSDSFNFKYWSIYNLEEKRLINQDYSLVKDFHCWEARLIYRGYTSQWWLTIAIKAFPSEEVFIGANQTKAILPAEGWQKF